jgi:hypothetical protein
MTLPLLPERVAGRVRPESGREEFERPMRLGEREEPRGLLEPIRDGERVEPEGRPMDDGLRLMLRLEPLKEFGRLMRDGARVEPEGRPIDDGLRLMLRLDPLKELGRLMRDGEREVERLGAREPIRDEERLLPIRDCDRLLLREKDRPLLREGARLTPLEEERLLPRLLPREKEREGARCDPRDEPKLRELPPREPRLGGRAAKASAVTNNSATTATHQRKALYRRGFVVMVRPSLRAVRARLIRRSADSCRRVKSFTTSNISDSR